MIESPSFTSPTPTNGPPPVKLVADWLPIPLPAPNPVSELPPAIAVLPGADAELLSPEDTTRILELARACKAAARAVLLYPSSHPAIAATLGRIVQTTSAESMRGAQ